MPTQFAKPIDKHLFLDEMRHGTVWITFSKWKMIFNLKIYIVF
jgi:hypothetical protein